MVARFPLPLNCGYTASKCAIAGLSEALDMELEGSGIRVTAVLPGITETEFTDAMVTRLPEPRSERRIPIASARHVADRMVACALRPRSTIYFIPAPRLVLAACDIFPGIWRAIARRYVYHRLSGERPA
jgi:short-subunit dehydrogenase